MTETGFYMISASVMKGLKLINQLKFAYYLKGNLEMRPYSQIPQETKNAYSQQVKFLFKADKKGRSSNIFGHSSSIDVANFEQVF